MKDFTEKVTIIIIWIQIWQAAIAFIIVTVDSVDLGYAYSPIPWKKGNYKPEIFYVVKVLLFTSVVGEDLEYVKERYSSKKGNIFFCRLAEVWYFDSTQLSK